MSAQAGRHSKAHRLHRQLRGQSLVEFSLMAPVVLFLAFATVDFGRLLYTYAAIADAAREGARLLTLQSQGQSDCLPIKRMETVGQGFPLQVDPASLVGDSDPNNPSGALQPSTPLPGQGLIYIWPAVATATPQDQGTNCDSTQQRQGTGCSVQADPCPPGQAVKHVAVEVSYRFIPITPLIGALTNGWVVKTIAVEQVEY